MSQRYTCPRFWPIVWKNSPKEEGTSVDGLVLRLVAAHLERRKSHSALRPGHQAAPRKDIRLPLIPREETGMIFPVTGADLDEMFARDNIAS